MSYLYRDDGDKGSGPHTGNKSVNPNYSYQYHDGKIHSGMTRVFWELKEVEKDKGGTAFVLGTHKSNYRKKRNLFDEWVSEVWESYSCPPGSLLIFFRGGAPHLVSMGAGRSAHGSLFLL